MSTRTRTQVHEQSYQNYTQVPRIVSFYQARGNGKFRLVFSIPSALTVGDICDQVESITDGLLLLAVNDDTVLVQATAEHRDHIRKEEAKKAYKDMTSNYQYQQIKSALYNLR